MYNNDLQRGILFREKKKDTCIVSLPLVSVIAILPLSNQLLRASLTLDIGLLIEFYMHGTCAQVGKQKRKSGLPLQFYSSHC